MSSLKTKLLSKIQILDCGCWSWSGYIAPSGYGNIYHAGATMHAHRVSYMVHKGDIPNGLCVLHSCDNRTCVNPEHLFLGTHRDNMQDMRDKGRDACYNLKG